MENVRLTSYSSGGGCGCKISPAKLEKILHSNQLSFITDDLLVGNNTKDDAAVFKFDDKNAIISTTDFFTPIVDDPFTFGKIAATNSISDIYAMGGTPLMAIAILGWPLNLLDETIAKTVLDGAKHVCNEAKIPLAGGHSIDIKEPVFGLAVTGKVKLIHLKRNDSAKQNSTLYLTKPLGIGIISSAIKQGIASKEHIEVATNLMCLLNRAGSFFATLPYVNAMTDVTGFGLFGHLLEICEGSNVSAEIIFKDVPIIDGINNYLKENCFPDGTNRNFDSFKDKICSLSEYQKRVLFDPQTSGGLLVSIDTNMEEVFLKDVKTHNINLYKIGNLIPNNDKDGPLVHIS